MTKIEGFDENYALASIIQIFIEIDEFRRFFILEKLNNLTLFSIYSKIFNDALKENKILEQEPEGEDDVEKNV